METPPEANDGGRLRIGTPYRLQVSGAVLSPLAIGVYGVVGRYRGLMATTPTPLRLRGEKRGVLDFWRISVGESGRTITLQPESLEKQALRRGYYHFGAHMNLLRALYWPCDVEWQGFLGTADPVWRWLRAVYYEVLLLLPWRWERAWDGRLLRFRGWWQAEV